MAQNDNVVFKTSTTATINDLFNWNKSTGQITAKTDSIPIVPGTVYFTADGHIVHDLTQNNRLWMSKNAYSAIYAKDISETNTDIANTIKYSIHYVEGPTTDTTAGTWTGTINGITELYDGLTIIYVPAIKGGSSTTTLNINGLGAKTCYYNNTSIITTHYSAGTPILLTYRNNCWRRADYNSNTTYSAMSVAEMRTGTATSERSIRADYLKTFLSTLGGTNLTLTHSNSAPYLQLNHDPSGITAGTYGNNSQQTPSYGGTFNIPYFTVDTQGHITNASITTVKIPESDNTDYKVRQIPINSNDNNNYRILLSNSANDTEEDNVSKKYINLQYNPSINKLSTGNLDLTGELNVIGDAYLHNQTTVDNATIGNIIINGNASFIQSPTAPTPANNDSSNKLATTEFVYNTLSVADAMIFKGVVNSANDLSVTHNAGWTYKVATAGTYAGVVCEVGDLIVCIQDGTTNTNSHWHVIQTNIDGAVTGPAGATTNHIATFNGNTGKIIQDSGYTIATSVPANAVFTDTKNTAGSTNTTDKLFLVGAKTQGNNPQTYSNENIYIQDGNKLRIETSSNNASLRVRSSVGTSNETSISLYANQGYKGLYDSTNNKWLLSISPSGDLASISSNFVPSESGIYSLGNRSRIWSSLYAKYLNLTTSNDGIILPFIINDLAFLTFQGGSYSWYQVNEGLDYSKLIISADSTIPNENVIQHHGTSGLNGCFNGTYETVSIGTKTTQNGILIIDINCPMTFSYMTSFYIDFGDTSVRAKTISLYVKKSSKTEYILVDSINDNAESFWHRTFNIYTLTASLASADSTYPRNFDQIRIVLTNWNQNDIGNDRIYKKRITQIGLIRNTSAGIQTVTMSKGQDDPIFRNITPYTSNTYNLGSSTNKWKNIYGNLIGNADTATNVDWSGITNKPTTISGYGITDANIQNGIITLGSNTIEVKTKQTAVNDVSTTNATTTEFISSITQDTNGVISVVKKKLPTYNNYIHPTGNGNNHIPADGVEGQYLKYSSAGTAQWVNLPAAAGTISNTSITPEGTNAKSKVIIKATTTDVYSMTSAGSVTNGSSAILTMSVDEETETLTYSWTTNTPTTVILPGRSAAIKTWTGYTTGVDNTYAEAQTFTGTATNHTHTFTGTAVN